MRRVMMALAVALCVAFPALGQVGTTMPAAERQFLDNNGDPCSGCKLYAFAAGTSTPEATYSDQSLMTANAHPVVLDSAGRATIFLSATTYDFQLDSAADVTIWTRSNVTATHVFTGATSTGDLTLQVDSDNDGTNTFDFQNGAGSTVFEIDEIGNVTLGFNANTSDLDITWDGNAQDFYIGIDDSVDRLLFGVGAVVGTTPAFYINSSQVVSFTSAPIGAKTCRVLYTTNTQNATDDGTQETLFSYSLPANSFGSPGDYVEITAGGTLAGDTDAKIIDIDFGGTTVATATTSTASHTAFHGTATVMRHSSTTTQKATGLMAPNTAYLSTYTTPAEDETGAITIRLTGDGINASDIVFEMATIRLCEA